MARKMVRCRNGCVMVCDPEENARSLWLDWDDLHRPLADYELGCWLETLGAWEDGAVVLREE